MPRPKGSKNKKTLAKTGTFTSQLDALKANLDKLNADKQAAESTIAEAQASLKTIKREIRKLETKIKNIEIKKAEADAIAANAEMKKALDTKVSELISGGHSVSDIMDALNKM